MLSFELSAIDLILVIAVVVLLILYITKLSTKTATQEKPSVEGKIPPERAKMEAGSLKAEEETQLPSHTQTDSPKCPYGFEYLKKLDKNAPIPDECLSCSRIMECFGSSE